MVNPSGLEALPSGLFTGTGGFLRPVVNVRQGNEAWSLRYSLWELAIPTRVIERNPLFRRFLERTLPTQEVNPLSDDLKNLLQLLVGQGCVTFDSTRESYSLAEIGFIIRALVADWYRLYYAHPFWEDLGNCRASLLQVFGWALRNYHLSKSAGPTAARGALHSPHAKVREVFFKSALEEHSHCDKYYFPQHAVFGLDRDWIKGLLPLPSSTAFDQHMSVIAEEDWLAHAISAFFQEYTAAFREFVFAAYERIERAYGLTGFFNGWKDHIGYDVSQSHADEFSVLFSGDGQIHRKDLDVSLGLAAMTVDYLIGALDELASIGRDVPWDTFRVSPGLIDRGATRSTVLGGIENLPSTVSVHTLGCLAELLSGLLHRKAEVEERVGAALEAALTLPFLASLVLRALSFATQHDEVVLLGKLADVFTSKINVDACLSTKKLPSAGHKAIQNFLRETARQPSEFLFLLRGRLEMN